MLDIPTRDGNPVFEWPTAHVKLPPDEFQKRLESMTPEEIEAEVAAGNIIRGEVPEDTANKIIKILTCHSRFSTVPIHSQGPSPTFEAIMETYRNEQEEEVKR